MILANTSAAELLRAKSINFISRVHPTPNDLAINELNTLLQSLNWKKIKRDTISAVYDKLLCTNEKIVNFFCFKFIAYDIIPDENN